MSLTKAEISRLRSLREKKHREELGLFVVEGEKVVGELLAADFPLQELYATDAWAPPGPGQAASPARPAMPEGERTSSPVRPKRSGSSVSPSAPLLTRVTADEMARISHFPTPSPVFAVGRLERATLAPGELDRGLTLALDGVQDAGNVGTLLRIADWFALDRVLLSPDCADLFSQKVINASMGSFARMRAVTAPLADVLAGTRTPVLGCDLGGTDVHALPAHRDAIIVVGSEGRGLSAPVRQLVTHYVTIPRYGAAESLNAGVAAAVVCDNLRRAQCVTQ